MISTAPMKGLRYLLIGLNRLGFQMAGRFLAIKQGKKRNLPVVLNITMFLPMGLIVKRMLLPQT